MAINARRDVFVVFFEEGSAVDAPRVYIVNLRVACPAFLHDRMPVIGKRYDRVPPMTVDAGGRFQLPYAEHGVVDAFGYLRIHVEMAPPADLGGRKPVLTFGPESPAGMVLGGEAEVAVRAADIPVGGVLKFTGLDAGRDEFPAFEDHSIFTGMTPEAVFFLRLGHVASRDVRNGMGAVAVGADNRLSRPFFIEKRLMDGPGLDGLF